MVFCEGDNSLVDCSKVVSAGERRRVLDEKRDCFNCTGAKHRAFQAKVKPADAANVAKPTMASFIRREKPKRQMCL